MTTMQLGTNFVEAVKNHYRLEVEHEMRGLWRQLCAARRLGESRNAPGYQNLIQALYTVRHIRYVAKKKTRVCRVEVRR